MLLAENRSLEIYDLHLKEILKCFWFCTWGRVTKLIPVVENGFALRDSNIQCFKLWCYYSSILCLVCVFNLYGSRVQLVSVVCRANVCVHHGSITHSRHKHKPCNT